MILTCPNCVSKFKLEASLLAPQGKRVRCSSCNEEWFQLPDPEELEEGGAQAQPEPENEHEDEDVEDILEFKDVPESVKPEPEEVVEEKAKDTFADVLSKQSIDKDASQETPKKAKVAGYIGALIIGAGIFASLIIAKDSLLIKHPHAAAFYQLLGMDVITPGENLVFDRVRANVTEDNQIYIEGFVINMMNIDQIVPPMIISLHKKNGDIIKSITMPPPPEMLEGEATLPFKTQYKGETKEADHAKLKFVLAGNKASETAKTPVEKHKDKTHIEKDKHEGHVEHH